MNASDKTLAQGDFKSAQSATGWIFKGIPVAGGIEIAAPIMDGTGWLKLIDFKKFQHTVAFSSDEISSGRDFDIEFNLIKQFSCNGGGISGGGFSIALVDAGLPGAGEKGTFGEAGNNLGYLGMKHAYVGIGFGVETQNNGFAGVRADDHMGRFISPLVGIRASEAMDYKWIEGQSLFREVIPGHAATLKDLKLPIIRSHALGQEFPFRIALRRSNEGLGYSISVNLNNYPLPRLQNIEYPCIAPLKLKVVLSAVTGNTTRDAYLVGQFKVVDMTSSDDRMPIEEGFDGHATLIAKI